MPSTLVSNHPSPYHPQLPRLKEFGCGLESYRRSPKILFETSRGNLPAQAARTRLTPPSRIEAKSTSAMSTYSNNVSHMKSWHARSASTVFSNAPPYSTPQEDKNGHSRKNSKTKPFYNNYYSAKQPQSPLTRKEPERFGGPAGQKPSEAGTDSIATHLQIPASINDSKGSLPEFAAQVRYTTFLLQRL